MIKVDKEKINHSSILFICQNKNKGIKYEKNNMRTLKKF